MATSLRRGFWAVSISLLMFALSASFALPAAAANGGVTISPAFQDITVPNARKSVAGSFTITNNSEKSDSYSLSAIDMGALDETGGLIFSGLSNNYQRQFGLSSWIYLSKTIVKLQAHTSQDIKFSIINSDSLGPGGHYGAIIIKSGTQEQLKKSPNRIGISPEAAELLFVRKTGGEIYNLSVKSGNISSGWFGLPGETKIDFDNQGNVHAVPRGLVVVKNMFGKEVARGIINPDSSIILPQHTRQYTVNLLKHGLIFPGRYKAEVSFRYDGLDQFRSFSFSFTVVNFPLIILSLLLTGALVYGLIYLNRKYGEEIKRKIRRIRRSRSKYIPKFLLLDYPSSKQPRRAKNSAQMRSFVIWSASKKSAAAKPKQPPKTPQK